MINANYIFKNEYIFYYHNNLFLQLQIIKTFRRSYHKKFCSLFFRNDKYQYGYNLTFIEKIITKLIIIFIPIEFLKENFAIGKHINNINVFYFIKIFNADLREKQNKNK